MFVVTVGLNFHFEVNKKSRWAKNCPYERSTIPL